MPRTIRQRRLLLFYAQVAQIILYGLILFPLTLFLAMKVDTSKYITTSTFYALASLWFVLLFHVCAMGCSVFGLANDSRCCLLPSILYSIGVHLPLCLFVIVFLTTDLFTTTEGRPSHIFGWTAMFLPALMQTFLAINVFILMGQPEPLPSPPPPRRRYSFVRVEPVF